MEGKKEKRDGAEYSPVVSFSFMGLHLLKVLNTGLEPP